MKRFTIVLILGFTCTFFSMAQVKYEIIYSENLGQERQIKVQLPRNYDPDAKRTYPLVIVLDGDYLFEPVAGNIDYHAYWEDIPDCIIVGINQSEHRLDDLYIEEETYFPAAKGADFYNFLGQDLVPFIESTYKASNFRIVVGHDMSANYMNFFLFKTQPLFRAYVALSPDFTAEMVNRLTERLATLDQETFYYMATADADITRLRQSILEAHNKFKTIENDKINYEFDDFSDANHYSLVGLGIPKAINQMFEPYKPINGKEYNEKILTFEGSPFEYLEKKYEDISYFYGFEKRLIENDVRAIAAASNERNDLDSLKDLAKLVKKEFPDSMMSAYYMGMYHEREGDFKRALRAYKSGLLLEPSQFITKEMMLEKMYDTQEILDN